MNDSDNTALIEKIIALINAKKSETSALRIVYELLIRI